MKLFRNWYAITSASNPDNIFDIIPVRMLMQKHYPRKGLQVIRVVKSREEALAVVTAMVQNAYEKTGGKEIGNYLRAKKGKKL